MLPSESKSDEGSHGESDDETSNSEHMMATTPLPSKKLKKSPELSSTVSGSKFFNRFWTNEDELALVKGLVEYQEKNDKPPVTAGDFSVLADELKSTFQVDYSIPQLMNKIKGLKKKFKKNLGNGYISANENVQKCLDTLKRLLSKD